MQLLRRKIGRKILALVWREPEHWAVLEPTLHIMILKFGNNLPRCMMWVVIPTWIFSQIRTLNTTSILKNNHLTREHHLHSTLGLFSSTHILQSTSTFNSTTFSLSVYCCTWSQYYCFYLFKWKMVETRRTVSDSIRLLTPRKQTNIYMYASSYIFLL